MIKAYQCRLTLHRDGEQREITLSVRFARNAEQAPSAEIRLPAGGLDGGQLIQSSRYQPRAGLNGLEIRAVHTADPARAVGCTASLVYRPADAPGSITAHLIVLTLDINPTGPTAPLDACQALEKIAGDIVAAAG